MPFSERGSSFSDPEVTGSITPRQARPTEVAGQVSPLSPLLDAEDWRRARAAMATALDPQGSGAQVRWDNPDSGAKGTFGAVGNPFVVKDEICRMFVAQVSVKGPEDWLQGNACRIGPGEWTIKEARPWKRPG